MYKNLWVLNCFLLATLLSSCTLSVAKLTPIKHIRYHTEKPDIDNSLVPFEDSKNHLYGYKDRFGKLTIPAKFTMAGNFNQYGIADVVLKQDLKGSNPNWVKINKSGKVLSYSYFFDNGPDYFVQGLSRFVKRGKIGFVDHKAQKVISAQFDWASPFVYDAPVSVVCNGCKSDSLGEHPEMKGGKWGAIDFKGKIIVPLEYEMSHAPSCRGRPDTEKYVTLTFTKDKNLYQLFQTQDGDYKIIKNGLSPVLK